ncbi:M48 family metalloprotease [Halostella sp. PRR32]|uniref:M48 family metallopeptidase n=1 Tax=Halostella sp. PRR32 TaxID=3098147 RepID=UPI002B1D2A55|nr:M48 family metalloprotease [Halostella sp. PRR32]
MRHIGLKLRMAFVGTILFAFYLAGAGFALLLFGTGAWPFVLVGTVLFAVFQYKVGKWLSLRSVGAEEMDEQQYSGIHKTVEDICFEMNMDKPKLMVADMGVPNAFATGRRGAGVVVVSRELIQLLDRDELEGVIAHELAHIDNRDVITMVLGQSIASIFGIAVQWAVMLSGDNDIADFVLGYIAGILTQMFVMLFVLAISRYREYVADSDAAQYIGSGDPLARALEKIQRGSQGRESRVGDDVSALCIFDSEGGLMKKILATHPPVEKRIEKLRSY